MLQMKSQFTMYTHFNNHSQQLTSNLFLCLLRLCGPGLFTDYSSPVVSIIKSFDISVHCDADYMQLNAHFIPGENESEVLARMERCCNWRSHIYLVTVLVRVHCVWKYVLCIVCAYVCALCIWFFVCAMRALVGFRGVGWPVRWRQLSEGAGQSALRK